MTTDITPERSLGWLKEPEDNRDYKLFQVHPEIALGVIAPFSDLVGSFMPPIGDQGQLGSCVAWGCVAGFRYAQKKMGLTDFDGSELFEYYNARAYQGWQNIDSGSYIRDGMKALGEFGNALENEWPYVISRFTERPPQNAYTNASLHQSTRYISIPNNDDAIDSVLSAGFPVVFGIPLYQNFPMGSGVNIIPMPQGQVIGGHCMAWVGHNRNTRTRKTRNSWSTGWGNGGYAEMPYDYCRQATDLWYIEIVEGNVPPPPPPPPPPIEKIVDGIGMWDNVNQRVVHLWPPRPIEEMNESVGGIGVHFTDGSTESVWPR